MSEKQLQNNLDTNKNNLSFINLAHFIYAVRDDKAGTPNIKKILEKVYPEIKNDTDQIFQLSPDKEMLIDRHYYIEVSTNHVIDIYFGLTKASIITGVVWRSNSDVFSEELSSEMEKINRNLMNELGLISGQASIFVYNKASNLERAEWLKGHDIDLSDENSVLVTALDFGNLKHLVPQQMDDRYNYILELDNELTNDALTEIAKFITNDFLKMDYTIQNLKKKINYFRDKRDSIISEKADIDRTISGVLHKQVVAVGEKARHDELESEVGNLSRMYGLLATNLNLLEDIALATGKDFLTLNRLQKLKLFDTRENAQNPLEIINYYKNVFTDDINIFNSDRNEMKLSLDNARAALGLIQARVELLRSNETMAMQKQTKELLDQNVNVQKELVALQVAAGTVEFVLVFYYVLHSWGGVITEHAFDKINAAAKIIPVALFSASVVAMGHFVAEAIKHKKIDIKLLASIAAAVLSLAAMYLISLAQH